MTDMMRARPAVVRCLAGFFGMLLAANAAPAAAQAPEPGDTVRVTTPEERIVGRLVAWEGEALVVRPRDTGEDRAIPEEAVERLEVRARTGHSAGLGALVGGAVGVGVGLGWSLSVEDPGAFSQGQLVLLSTTMAGGGGAGLGAMVGYLVPSHRWEEASGPGLRVRTSPAPGGGAAVSFGVPLW